MTLQLAFWILMLLWLVGYGFAWESAQPWRGRMPDLLLFLIILVLGWHAFGAPIKG